MFGRKGIAQSGEIDISSLTILQGAREFVRMWNDSAGTVVAIVDPTPLGPDPFAFGLALVDAAKHGAKAYAHAVGMSEDEAMALIWAGFDAERASPTDTPIQITGRPH